MAGTLVAGGAGEDAGDAEGNAVVAGVDAAGELRVVTGRSSSSEAPQAAINASALVANRMRKGDLISL